MTAVDHSKVEKSTGYVLRDLSGAVLAPLIRIGECFGIGKVFRWLQDEARRNATIRELNRLSDHYLDDIGAKRCDIDFFADEMVKRLREGAYDPR